MNLYVEIMCSQMWRFYGDCVDELWRFCESLDFWRNYRSGVSLLPLTGHQKIRAVCRKPNTCSLANVSAVCYTKSMKSRYTNERN